MTAIFLSLSVRNHAVIGDVGRQKKRKIPHPIVRGPKIKKMICQVAYLLFANVLPDTPYVMPSAMKDPIPPPAHQIDARRGCSFLVQYCDTNTVRIGDRQVSNAPRKNLQTARVAKEFVAAMHVVTIPQRRTMAPKYLPSGSFCMRIELGYWKKR